MLFSCMLLATFRATPLNFSTLYSARDGVCMIAIRLNGLHWAQVSLFLVGWFSTSYVTSFMSQFGSLTSHVDSLPPSRFRLSSAQWGLGFVCPRLMLANALSKFPNLFCCFPNVLGRFPHTWYVVSLTTQVGLLDTEISSPITSASSLMSKSSGWSTKGGVHDM